MLCEWSGKGLRRGTQSICSKGHSLNVGLDHGHCTRIELPNDVVTVTPSQKMRAQQFLCDYAEVLAWQKEEQVQHIPMSEMPQVRLPTMKLFIP